MRALESRRDDRNQDIRSDQPIVSDNLGLTHTYVGDRNGDRGNGIAVDSSGNAYIAGYIHSKNLPTVNPVQAAFAGGNSMKRFCTPRHYHQGEQAIVDW